jgi:putative peptidoglycan lipid II flippase
MPETPPPRRRFGGALAVSTGIALSRLTGLVRERAIAHYLGNSAAAGAFRAAMWIPNLLQNLLGEGVLSASFIPVYKRLIVEGRHEDASRLARAIGTLLALVASGVALLGVALAGPLVDLLAPGFEGESRELTITLVRILFPGMAILVMSAWCLGVLNSHRRMFLPYVAPVVWNAALIATAIVAGRRLAGHDDDIAVWLAWGAVIGSAAQLAVQLPSVISLLRGLRPSLATRDEGVRTTLRNFVPIFIGRGSVQISAFIDHAIASVLGEMIVAAMFNAQTLYMLPVSLFGMAVSAAELPEMAGATGDDAARVEHVVARLRGGLRRVTFFVTPSAIAFAAIGGAIVALLFETGRFGAKDTEVVWIILAGSAIGLLPSTWSRLLGSAFYALGEPKRPLYASLVRVTTSAIGGFIVAIPLRDALGYSAAWGAFGLTAASAFAGWIEFVLLAIWLRRRLGTLPFPWRMLAVSLVAAALAGAAGYAAGAVTHAFVAIPVFGAVYLGVMLVARQRP